MSYAFKKDSGISIDELVSIPDHFGETDNAKAKDPGYEVWPRDAWLEQPMEILMSTVLENQVRADNAPKIHAKVRLIV